MVGGSQSHEQSGSGFLTTRWSVVLAAGAGDSRASRDAMAELCRVYWRPLYGYVRRRGYSRHDAEDLTQGFFARLLAREDVAAVRPERGRFRSYLLGAMNHYLSDQRDRACAQKRGGGQVLTVDFAAAEAEYQAVSADDAEGPDAAFDRQWANTLLCAVQDRLRERYHAEGKGDWFEALRHTLSGERGDAGYAEMAAELGATEGAVKTAVHRLRRRYRRTLRDLVSETVAEPEDVEDELRHLLRALAGQAGV